MGFWVKMTRMASPLYVRSSLNVEHVAQVNAFLRCGSTQNVLSKSQNENTWYKGGAIQHGLGNSL